MPSLCYHTVLIVSVTCLWRTYYLKSQQKADSLVVGRACTCLLKEILVKIAILEKTIVVSGEINMSKRCQVTGIGPMSGHHVSHANNKRKRRFLPNLQKKRFWLEGERRFIRLRVSAKGMRLIDIKGIDQIVADMRARGEKI